MFYSLYRPYMYMRPAEIPPRQLKKLAWSSLVLLLGIFVAAGVYYFEWFGELNTGIQIVIGFALPVMVVSGILWIFMAENFVETMKYPSYIYPRKFVGHLNTNSL